MKAKRKVKNHFPKGFLMAGHKRKPPKRPKAVYDFSAEVARELKRLARAYPYPMFGALDELAGQLELLARDIRLVRRNG
jgi:hypothetical protein